jgi:hypothetical protein
MEIIILVKLVRLKQKLFDLLVEFKIKHFQPKLNLKLIIIYMGFKQLQYL